MKKIITAAVLLLATALSAFSQTKNITVSAGAALSLTVMTLMKKKSGFSILGISVAGGVSHNIGQLIIASLITMTSGLIYYAPALLISGVITGLLIGTLTSEVLKRIRF